MSHEESTTVWTHITFGIGSQYAKKYVSFGNMSGDSEAPRAWMIMNYDRDWAFEYPGADPKKDSPNGDYEKLETVIFGKIREE